MGMLSEISSVHFVGICGTAMASAAVAMQEKGFNITGSEQNVYPPMSTFLAERNIQVISGYSEGNLAHKPDLVVIGNAISRGNPEAEFVLDDFAQRDVRRAQVVGVRNQRPAHTAAAGVELADTPGYDVDENVRVANLLHCLFAQFSVHEFHKDQTRASQHSGCDGASNRKIWQSQFEFLGARLCAKRQPQHLE